MSKLRDCDLLQYVISRTFVSKMDTTYIKLHVAKSSYYTHVSIIHLSSHYYIYDQYHITQLLSFFSPLSASPPCAFSSLHLSIPNFSSNRLRNFFFFF